MAPIEDSTFKHYYNTLREAREFYYRVFLADPTNSFIYWKMLKYCKSLEHAKNMVHLAEEVRAAVPELFEQKPEDELFSLEQAFRILTPSKSS